MRSFEKADSLPFGGLIEQRDNACQGITATEGYLEADMPLAKDVVAAKSIDLNGAVRETHYDRNGAGTASTVNANTWKLGLVWEPIEALRLRATRSQDIRAPNLSELFGPKTTGFGILNDPARNGLQTNPVTISGSNPTLVPEVADTKTAGFVVRPTMDNFLGRTRLSLDYFDISIKDAIGTLGGSNTNHVKAALYLDLVGHYQIAGNDHSNLEIYAGMNNIANVDPPRVPGANGTGNNVLCDPIGRTWILGLRFKE
ncbi:MAG TPA: TonB-dependent receptor [Steroidobacteraceae bacterium]